MMMRKIFLVTGIMTLTVAFMSCGGPRRDTGRAYMPDMYYSRAYETYAPLDTASFTNTRSDWGSHSDKIYYIAKPVEGTVARGDMMPYRLQNDSAGYNMSASIRNPLDSVAVDMREAERLYLINCAICHGAKLDGNGPLYKGGDGPYIAKPATLVGDAVYEAMPEGKIFHSITYGKGAMGPYASQLSTTQRWMVTKYVKMKQTNKGGAAPAGGAILAGDTTTPVSPAATGMSANMK